MEAWEQTQGAVRRAPGDQNKAMPFKTYLMSFIIESLSGHGSTLQGGAYSGAAVSLALEQVLTVLVHVQLGDDDVAGLDADGDGLAVDLLAGDAFDVDDPLATVHLDNLAFTTLVGTADDHDFVVDADGHGAGAVLGAQLLGQRSAHDDAALMGGSVEVSLPGLATGRADV